MAGFQDLKVWKRSADLAVEIYRLNRRRPWSSDHGLRDQLRRACVSVPSNIAEGDARRSVPDSRRFFVIAMGSLAEVHTQLHIAHEIDYTPTEEYERLLREVIEIQKMLSVLIRARSMRTKGNHA